jgi:hypothetical protein
LTIQADDTLADPFEYDGAGPLSRNGSRISGKRSHFMKRDPLVYIDDIRDSIEAVKRYTAGLTKEDF